MSRGLGNVERHIIDMLARAQTGVSIATLSAILDGYIDPERWGSICKTVINNWSDEDREIFQQEFHPQPSRARSLRRAVHRLERQGLAKVRTLHGSHEKHWGGCSRELYVELTKPKKSIQDESTSYASEVSSPDLPDVSRAHPGFDAHTYLTKSELLTRGWTDNMVMDFLHNKPDVLLGGYEQSENMLYARERVVAVETSPAFQKRQRHLEQSRARRRKHKQHVSP